MRTALFVITALCGLSLLTGVPRYRSAEVDAAGITRAEDWLAANDMPLPANWQWHAYDYGEGQMRWGIARAEADRGTLIFVPGYSNYIEAYAAFLDPWHAAGFTIVAVDLPGQGGSSRRADYPEKPITGDFSWYAEQLAGFLEEQTEAATSPVTIVAESFGAHVTLRAAAEGHLEADRIALIVPGLELKTEGLPTGVIKGVVSGLTHLGYGHRYAPTQGPWAPNWHKTAENFSCATRPDRVYQKEGFYSLHPEFRIGGITNEWATGFDRSGRELVAGDMLAGVSAEVLMIEAGKDKILDYTRTDIACDEKLAACRRITLPEAGHCLLFEPDEVTAPMIEAVEAFAAGG